MSKTTIPGTELRDRMLRQLQIAQDTGKKPPPDPVIERFKKPLPADYDKSKE